MSQGSSTNLPFSIDNILREDFGPQRTQAKTIPRYNSLGYYVGVPWPYYYYKHWPLVVSPYYGRLPVTPMAGAVGILTSRQSPTKQESFKQAAERLETRTPTDNESQSADSEPSDSESGEIQPTNNRGKRAHEETTTTSTNHEEPKKKRPRSQFTELQLKYLENYFKNNNSYLSRDERTVLAQALDLTELQIRNWFQNKRYQKKHKETTTTTSSKDEKSGTPCSKS